MFVLRTALNDLRRRLRDPMALLLWMGIPLAIGGMISLAFGGSSDGKGPVAQVWVVDQDDSLLSGLLLNALAAGAERGVPVSAEQVSLERGRALIEDGEGSGLLVVPKGFGEAVLRDEDCVLRLTSNPAQRYLPLMVEETLQLFVDAVFYVQRVLHEPIERIMQSADDSDSVLPDLEVAEVAVLINQAIGRVEHVLNPPLIQLEVESNAERQEEADEEPAAGFAELFFPSMLFMALFFMAEGMGEDFWVERGQGTLRRVLMTPHRASEFLAGKLLGAGVLIGAVGLIGMLTARFAFGLHLMNFGLATLWAVLAGAFLLLLILPLQLFASSQKAGSLMTNLVMMPLLMLGGSFFPFEAMPEGMAAAGRLTPNGWVLVHFKNIILNDYSPASLGLGALGIFLVSALLFVVCQRRIVNSFGVN